MRAALAVAVVEAVVLVALAFIQFKTSEALGGNVGADPTLDPLVSTLGRVAVFFWLAASALIGVLVGRARGRVLAAAGLAFGAEAFAILVSPILEQLAASGRTLLESGRGPRGVYIFVPPNGWASDSAYVPVLVAIAIVVGGGIASLEASVAARLARRWSR